MKKIVITGFALANASSMTGIQRVCRELLLRLDQLLEGEGLEVEYIYPERAQNVVISPEEFHNIKPVSITMPFLTRNKYYRQFWQRHFLDRYAKKKDAVGCCLAFEWSFGKRNVSFIHDIRSVDAKYDRFMFRLKSRYHLKKCKRGCTLALTGSDVQNRLIREYFGWREERVRTVYLGWEHMKGIVSDEAIFERLPRLKTGEFYYTIGSLAPHKNFDWVKEVAKRNPEKLFVIAGGKELQTWKDNIEDDSLSNVLFVGRVTDEEHKALLEHCKAFLFPSKYEGFGIPPLEALACGAQVACSNATCLPEVYEDCVRYFDPDDYDVNLDELMEKPVASPEKILEKCSWDKAAKQLLDILKTI